MEKRDEIDKLCGRNLGSKFTKELHQATEQHDTQLIDVGDYFIVNGEKWIIIQWICNNKIQLLHCDFKPTKDKELTTITGNKIK